MQQRQPIDLVITWVDGTDPQWKQKRAMYHKEQQFDSATDLLTQLSFDGSEARYRDWNLLKYWFRAVEAFAPWARRIHLVTDHQIPAWLKTTNPRLHLVNHEDFIPEEYLPTFNSNVIELFLHRIPGLSEHFIYFNDDVFLTGPVREDEFFHRNLPCDMLALQPVVANPANPCMTHIYQNNSLVLCRHFQKYQNMRQQPGAYFHLGYPIKYWGYNLLECAYPLFTGFYSIHGAMPFCKSSFELVWKEERKQLMDTATHKFRDPRDVSIYLIREWQKLSGQFYPSNVERIFYYYEISKKDPNAKQLRRQLASGKRKTICVNDSADLTNVKKMKQKLHHVWQQFLPEVSSFEKEEES